MMLSFWISDRFLSCESWCNHYHCDNVRSNLRMHCHHSGVVPVQSCLALNDRSRPTLIKLKPLTCRSTWARGRKYRNIDLLRLRHSVNRDRIITFLSARASMHFSFILEQLSLGSFD